VDCPLFYFYMHQCTHYHIAKPSWKGWQPPKLGLL
jgi:hypothetical protein